MINHLRDQDIGIMADRHDSERLRGLTDRRTNRQTFAILESLLQLKRYVLKCGAY